MPSCVFSGKFSKHHEDGDVFFLDGSAPSWVRSNTLLALQSRSPVVVSVLGPCRLGALSLTCFRKEQRRKVGKELTVVHFRCCYRDAPVFSRYNTYGRRRTERRWKGLPENSSRSGLRALQQEKQNRERSLDAKKSQLADLLVQQISFRNLARRNRSRAAARAAAAAAAAAAGNGAECAEEQDAEEVAASKVKAIVAV